MAKIPAGSDSTAFVRRPAVSQKPVSRRQIGAQYEKQARDYLERAGLVFIAANVRFDIGELDLIMRDARNKGQLVFVEVRYRHSAHFGYAQQTVDLRKQQKLRRAAARWLAQQGKSLETTNCRFDVLAITGNQLEWLENAFGAEEGTGYTG
jgi:putative endonuclease